MQGVCYHLYSRARSAALAEFQLPELQRCPLEELCLQVATACCLSLLLQLHGLCIKACLTEELACCPCSIWLCM